MTEKSVTTFDTQ